MLDLSIVLAGLQDAFTPTNLLFVAAGVFLGQMVGAIPGIGPVMAMAIAIPFTFALEPLVGISFLVGINKGGIFGGAIPAILINTPGTPDAAATALDGHPLARKGKPLKASKMALYASVTGDTFSDLVLITVSAPLAVVALMMGPVEVFALMVFAFTIIAGLVGSSIVKGLVAALLGLLAATVGLDPEHGTPRFYFGQFQLFDGVPLVAVAIGMLAVSEIVIRLAAATGDARPAVRIAGGALADRVISFGEYWGCRFVMVRGAVIGTMIGAVPGIGSTAAAFMSYAAAKRVAPASEGFGEGALKGIAATESANSAVMGANLIPLLAIGIPGSISAALLISAFKIHGIQPGPLLFETQGQLIYGLFGAMILANLCNLVIGQVSMRLWCRVVQAPEALIFAAALLCCFVGVYVSTGGLFGVTIMLIAAAVAWAMRLLGYPVIVFIIALFLGDNFERTLSQTLVVLNGRPQALLEHPVALTLFCLSLVSVIYLGQRRQ